ncbi:MAG: cysteine desulfurase CsdA [Proteobacteria bacterium]|nr:MAG: cysteine desulfurase CsdA [Pseudomonadota bacterium]
MIDVAAVRGAFPALRQRVHGKPLVYLDNGATTHKPVAVLEALNQFYGVDNSNVHRGVHALSQRATAAYEAARVQVQRFLNAPSADEIVFTRGTTESINLVAQSWGRANLGPGDQVVISEMEHHSMIVPWQMACEATGAELVVLRMNDRGELPASELDAKIGPRVKLVGVVHVSNALGTVNPVAAIVARAHAVGALVLVDGAQSAPHVAIDVQALGVDFFAFSGHKVYGPTGVGVLWGRRALLAEMPPWQGGGDMIERVSLAGATYAAPPARFEAGTPHIAGAIGLGAACEWLSGLGLDAVAAHEAALLAHGTEVLGRVPGLALIGTAADKAGILAFDIAGLHPHDVGTIVDLEGVAVRVGHHCAQPAMERFGVSATTRASLGVYNTREDLDRLGVALHKAVDLLG